MPWISRAKLEQLRQRAAAADLRPAEAPRALNVRDLMPATCAADPSAPSAGAVRLAFRAHVHFRNAVRASLDWRDLVTLECEDDMRRALLCEYYARAILESAFSAHFDGPAAPRTDQIVIHHIAEAFGAAVAADVHATTERDGYVLRPFPADLARTDPTDPKQLP